MSSRQIGFGVKFIHLTRREIFFLLSQPASRGFPLGYGQERRAASDAGKRQSLFACAGYFGISINQPAHMCCRAPAPSRPPLLHPMMQHYPHALVAQEEALALPFNPRLWQIKSAG